MSNDLSDLNDKIMRDARCAYTQNIGAPQETIIRSVVIATLRVIVDEQDKSRGVKTYQASAMERFCASYDDSASEDAIPISPAV
jgi:hypothetical protein